MRMLEDIARQRAWFLQRDLRPSRLLCPLSLRHQLLGECAEQYLVDYRNGVDKLNVMGLRVVFSHDVSAVEVAMTKE